jgi:hypothetical protein
LFEYLGRWRGRVHTYDAASERVYEGFTPRLTQELKDDARIAAIAISRGAAVWKCNMDRMREEMRQRIGNVDLAV